MDGCDVLIACSVSVVRRVVMQGPILIACSLVGKESSNGRVDPEKFLRGGLHWKDGHTHG